METGVSLLLFVNVHSGEIKGVVDTESRKSDTLVWEDLHAEGDGYGKVYKVDCFEFHADGRSTPETGHGTDNIMPVK